MKDKFDFITKEELRRLYYDEGLTHEQVAQRLFCHVSTVRKYMRHFGMVGRSASERKKPDRYYVGNGEYLTAGEIAERAGVTLSTIRGRIHRGWVGEKLLISRKEAISIRGNRY